jgi:hypothetical protein
MPSFKRRSTNMARQQAAQRPIGARRTSDGDAGGTAGVIRFEPELAVHAIVFHLLDEGITNEVIAETTQATIGRLHRSTLRPTVARAIWSQMTNPQRLEWLLEHTGTVARLLDHETSVLEPMSR